MKDNLVKKLELYLNTKLTQEGNTGRYITSDGKKIAIHWREKTPFMGVAKSTLIDRDVDFICLAIEASETTLLIPKEKFDGINFATKKDGSRIVFSVVFDEEILDNSLTIRSEDGCSRLDVDEYAIELPLI